LHCAALGRDQYNGAWKQTLEGHIKTVRGIAFSPDGQTLASTSYDHTVRFWDATTGAWKQTFEINADIMSLSFSADGRYINTNKGVLSFDSGSPGIPGHQQQLVYAVEVRKKWVNREGQKFLWLPPDYRAECSTVYNNILALGHKAGRVTFLEFALS
jgi:WD domain, G-beta repeat